mmetsp:Transcript_3452/g.9651  ORF Transcript_3452/g.9651 Transcript_3452/m.9651 type:complete len:256 (+) Transcript_3452:373-1140(+)
MEPNSKLADLLLLHQTCSSIEEAEVIAEIVLECEDTNDVFAQKDILVENLIDNLGVEEAQARKIIVELERNVITGANSDNEESGSDDDGESSSSKDSTDDDDADDGVEYLVDGECELCDRYIKLTKHHLVPKSTWPRMQTKLLHAAEAIEKGDRDKALLILGPGLEDLLEDGENSRGGGHSRHRMVLSSDKAVVRAILHDTCDICRQCHTTVHRTHGNMDLALYYNTVEKLLGNEDISKFCKWASKQKAGKYSRS